MLLSTIVEKTVGKYRFRIIVLREGKSAFLVYAMSLFSKETHNCPGWGGEQKFIMITSNANIYIYIYIHMYIPCIYLQYLVIVFLTSSPFLFVLFVLYNMTGVRDLSYCRV